MRQLLLEAFRLPYRIVRTWLLIVRDQARWRREFPDGGRCHTCGVDTRPGQTDCEECLRARQW